MSYSRRRFLFLSSLGGLGLATGTKIISGKKAQYLANSQQINQEKLAPEKPLWRFVSIADTGTGAQGQYAVAQAMHQYYQQNPYSLVIMAGDNIYNDGEIEKVEQVFERPYAPLLEQGVKFHACLGNHDIRTDNGEPQVRYPGFNMQGRYYTFKRDPVQFFALDTNYNADWNNQLIWLKQELSQSSSPWKVVFGHHQIYASGAYGMNPALIEILTPLFVQYNVQLYVNGHEHHYERSKPINGTTYLICGAGAGARPVGRSEWTAYSASRLSFAAYNIYADRILIQGIGTDGNVFDSAHLTFNVSQ